jgi:hypothetical protein
MMNRRKEEKSVEGTGQSDIPHELKFDVVYAWRVY